VRRSAASLRVNHHLYYRSLCSGSRSHPYLHSLHARIYWPATNDNFNSERTSAAGNAKLYITNHATLHSSLGMHIFHPENKPQLRRAIFAHAHNAPRNALLHTARRTRNPPETHPSSHHYSSQRPLLPNHADSPLAAPRLPSPKWDTTKAGPRSRESGAYRV